MRQLVTRALVTAVVVIAAGLATVSPAVAEQGRVKFAKPAQADLENVGIQANRSFISSHYWRVRAYPPSWNSYLPWFPGAWGYKNAYALYNPQAYAPGHVEEPRDEWILRDSQGRRLYIPFDCNGQYCTQFAADMGNPAFRRWWIDGAKEYVRQGYRGVFVDDMTIFPRVGDAAGNGVTPIDPRTGQPMTDAAWAKYAVEFMEQLRAELEAVRPDVELTFNILWYHPDLGGPQEAWVKRLIAASDFLEIERGYTDTHPGSGKYGWETCLRWVDYAHSRGKGIVADSYANTRSGAEYELATSLLVNEGRDSLSTGYKPLPGNWWSGYEVDLGTAKGRRYPWHGGYRRDFEGGSVVVAPPGATVNGALEAPLKDLDGGTRTSVSLGGKQGLVLVGPSPADPAPPSPQPAVEVDPIPNPHPAPGAGTPLAERTPVAAEPPARGRKPSRRPRSKPRALRLRRLRGAVLVRGRVLRATRRRLVRAHIRRRTATGWAHARSATIRVGKHGRFRRTFRRLRRGRYTVRAVYLGPRRASSRHRSFVLRR